MYELYKIYKKSQLAQYEWIRKHPTKWVLINVILLALLFAYFEYQSRQEMRDISFEE